MADPELAGSVIVRLQGGVIHAHTPTAYFLWCVFGVLHTGDPRRGKGVGTAATACGSGRRLVRPAEGERPRGANPGRSRAWGVRNRFELKDPRRDSFSVRGFWIELELADGRRCSSDVSTATYSQPGEWLYAEGIGVPFGREIEVDLWFRP